jgi:glycolate oxidase FAD binding subunit
MLMTELTAPRLPAAPYALDALTPTLALRPTTVAEACDAMAAAHREGLAVVPWGGGTHQGLGNRLTRYDMAIDTRGLAGVVDHQPADLTLTVQAGMTLDAVQAYLAPYGQWLPLEAERPAQATIGGLLATGTAGPLRLAVGAPRDLTLWVEAVQPDGTLVHGGAKVVKNVAGYDTPKLFVGSLGSVGLLTAATFRVAPRPATAPTLLVGFDSPESARTVVMTLAEGRLFPSLLTLVSGEAGWGAPFDFAPWVLAVGADGPAPTTAWQLAQFAAIARQSGATAMTTLDGDISAQARQALMAHRGGGAVGLKLSLPPSAVVPLLALAAGQPSESRPRAFAEVGTGVVRLDWETPGTAWRAIADHVEALGGAWVLTHCPLDWKQAPLDVWGPARGDRVLMCRLKAALDPRGVLSPGRFVGG